MKECVIFAVFVFVLTRQGSVALDCCSAYTDPFGNHHESQLCSQYCCVNLDVEYKVCCDDSTRQVPASERENEQCTDDWLNDNMAVILIGGGVVGLLLLFCLCICCRRNPRQGIIVTGAPPASTTVVMASTNMTTNNPAHMGYNQPITTAPAYTA